MSAMPQTFLYTVSGNAAIVRRLSSWQSDMMVRMYGGDSFRVNFTRTLTGASALFELIEVNTDGSFIRVAASRTLSATTASINETFPITRLSVYRVRLTNNSATNDMPFSGEMRYTKNAQNPSFPRYLDYEIDSQLHARWLPREILGQGGQFTCVMRVWLSASAISTTGLQTATNAARTTWGQHGGGRASITTVANPNDANVLFFGVSTPPPRGHGDSMASYMLFDTNGHFATTYSWINGRYYVVKADVQFYRNNFVGFSADLQRRYVARELGHVMGLGRTQVDSIVNGSNTSLASNPTNRDRTGLALFYGN
jgi:hypothetical protein